MISGFAAAGSRTVADLPEIRDRLTRTANQPSRRSGMEPQRQPIAKSRR